MFQTTCLCKTNGQGLYDITPMLENAVEQWAQQERSRGVEPGAGMCNVFVQHTSCSLCIQENGDPDSAADLEEFMRRLVPFAPWFRHTLEGRDDMPSHIKSALTHTSLDIPVRGGRAALGTWQSLYLWEHRDASHNRKLVITVF